MLVEFLQRQRTLLVWYRRLKISRVSTKGFFFPTGQFYEILELSLPTPHYVSLLYSLNPPGIFRQSELKE